MFNEDFTRRGVADLYAGIERLSIEYDAMNGLADG